MICIRWCSCFIVFCFMGRSLRRPALAQQQLTVGPSHCLLLLLCLYFSWYLKVHFFPCCFWENELCLWVSIEAFKIPSVPGTALSCFYVSKIILSFDFGVLLVILEDFILVGFSVLLPNFFLLLTKNGFFLCVWKLCFWAISVLKWVQSSVLFSHHMVMTWYKKK